MTPPVVNPADTLALTNESDKQLRMNYDGRLYAAEPGQTITVPFPLVTGYFGDPRSGPTKRNYKDDNGRSGQIPSRDQERKRLSQLWGVAGVYSDLKEDAEREHKPLPPLPPIEQIAPKVSVKTALGEQVKTVIDDPHGDDMVLVATNLDSPSSVAAEVARISQQLEKMKEIQDALQKQPNPDAASEVTEDGPGFDPPSS